MFSTQCRRVEIWWAPLNFSNIFSFPSKQTYFHFPFNFPSTHLLNDPFVTTFESHPFGCNPYLLLIILAQRANCFDEYLHNHFPKRASFFLFKFPTHLTLLSLYFSNLCPMPQSFYTPTSPRNSSANELFPMLILRPEHIVKNLRIQLAFLRFRESACKRTSVSSTN